MREFPEALAHVTAPTLTTPFLRAASASGCQVPQLPLHTVCIYGYLVGEEADTLLCGHPDLMY